MRPIWYKSHPGSSITLSTPIGLVVQNTDQRPHDYSEINLSPRPSCADRTYPLKYGIKTSSGGGRSSACETIGSFLCSLCIIHASIPYPVFQLQVQLPKCIPTKFSVSKLSLSSLPLGKVSIPSTQPAKTLSGEAPSEDDDGTEDALTPRVQRATEDCSS